MSLVKSLYEENFQVYGAKTTAQKCMFCREDLCDHFMGEDWAIKLNKIQGIMMHKWVEKVKGVSKDGIFDMIDELKKIHSPNKVSYEIFEECVKDGRSVKQICLFAKFLSEQAEDLSIDELKKGYKSIFNDDNDEESEDEIEVEIEVINGKEYYYDPKEKKYYDPDTYKEVEF